MVDYANFWKPQRTIMAGNLGGLGDWWNQNDTGTLDQRFRAVTQTPPPAMSPADGEGSRDRYERAWDNLGVGQVAGWSGAGGDPGLVQYQQRASAPTSSAGSATDPSVPGNTSKPSLAGQGGGGGNSYGYSYTDPGGGWNPVSLLDARRDFDGTAVDGYYNAAADKGTSWGAGEPPELDRARVWRWTMDDLKGDFSNPELVKQAFLSNVARLRRDYEAPENRARGLNWQGSAFSGYDRFLQGGGTAAAGASGAGGTTGGQQGQTGGQPVSANNGPGYDPQGSGTSQGGSAMPATGNTLFSPAAIANAARDQRAAYDMYQMFANGGSLPGGHGPFEQFYESFVGPIFQAAINAASMGAGGQLPGDITSLFGRIQQGLGNGGDIFSYLGQLAQSAMRGQPLNGASFQDATDQIRTLAPLTAFGLNPIARNTFYTGQDDMIRQAQSRAYTRPDLGQGLTDWDTFYNSQPFMDRYYGR